MSKKIVVTGMGTINPLGDNVKDFWKAIREGKNGITLNERFDTTNFATKIAGQVKNFKASNYMDKKEARKMGLFTQYAVIATGEALRQAGLSEGRVRSRKIQCHPWQWYRRF